MSLHEHRGDADGRYLAHIEHPIRGATVGDDWTITAGIGRGVIDGVSEILINLNGHVISEGKAIVRKVNDRWLIIESTQQTEVH